jgi:CheY-like chemotaxis protein
LFEITDLHLSKKLASMTDSQLDDYIILLNYFVDNFSHWEQELRAAVEAYDISSISKHLSGLRNILIKLNADKLANDCLEQLNNINETNSKRITAYVNYFLSILSALSIDIQLAILKGSNNNERPLCISEETLVGQNKSVKVILAVDDETLSLDVLKAALKGVSCSIIGVTSGADALNVLKTRNPDLFVLDIDMPEMNGIELAKKIRALGYCSPIIFITGNANKDYVMRAIATGASDFIVKPINPQSAKDRIGKFL